jgi:hypothetical protein
VLQSPSLSPSASERSEQDATDAVHVDASTSDEQHASSQSGSAYEQHASSQSGSACGGDDQSGWLTASSSDSDDAPIPARRVNPFGGGATAQRQQGANGNSNSSHLQPHFSNDCGSRHRSKENCASSADALAGEEHQAIRMAAHMISLAAKKPLAEAYSILLKHITLQGNLPDATQFACQELMDGPRQARPTPKINEVPDEDTGISLAKRQLGESARTPTVRELAKRFKLNNPDEDRRPTLDDRRQKTEDRQPTTGNQEAAARANSPPKPQRLFDAAYEAQTRAAGGGLTAGQRIATAMRGADNALWRQAMDKRFSTAPAEFGDDEGNTPCSAALLGNHTMGSTAAAVAARNQITAPKPAAHHSSPGVRIAEQMRLKREQQAIATQQGQGTIVVVNSTGNKLPTWKPGNEAEGKGFNWKTKQMFDTIYFDIWPTISTDNLAEMATLNRRFARRLNPGGWRGSWMEDSLKYDRRRNR